MQCRDKLEGIILTRALTVIVITWSNSIKINISKNSIKIVKCQKKSENSELNIDF